MRGLLVALAMVSIGAAPAIAQSQVPAQVPADQAPAAKQKTETKQVCENVQAERGTGSRLGSTVRVCRTVEVQAKDAAKGSGKAELAPHAH